MFKCDKRSVTSSSSGGGVIVSRDSPLGGSGFGGDGPLLHRTSSRAAEQQSNTEARQHNSTKRMRPAAICKTCKGESISKALPRFKREHPRR